jgi:hypothetical protein
MSDKSSTAHPANPTNSNKRKRDDGDGDDLLAPKQMQEQQLSVIERVRGEDNPSLSTMPETILLHIFTFLQTGTLGIDERTKMSCTRAGLMSQLALEKTCQKFSALLHKDSTMRLLYQPLEDDLGFDYRVESLREKLFIYKGLNLIRRFQHGNNDGTVDDLLCDYMGGADGVRRVIDNMLIKIEQPGVLAVVGDRHLRPAQYPENGFKLFLRGDSIAYLTEVVGRHMVYKLEGALHAAMFRSNPPSSHPYPMVCPGDILHVDRIRGFDPNIPAVCVIGSHCCSRLSLGDTPKMLKWPDDNCMVEDVIGAEQLHSMVRAIAGRAGIVKLTGAAFDCIAAEILHFMANIVIDAFEASKSLWCPHADVGTNTTNDGEEGGEDATVAIEDWIFFEENDDSSTFSEDSEEAIKFNYFANHPPPPVAVDEEGRHVCVVIPRQIEDAAVRLGMKPLLFGQNWSNGNIPMWTVSEGRTLEEEVEEAKLMYDSSSDEDSVDEAGLGEENDDESVCDCPHCVAARANEVANDVNNAVDEAADSDLEGNASDESDFLDRE